MGHGSRGHSSRRSLRRRRPRRNPRIASSWKVVHGQRKTRCAGARRRRTSKERSPTLAQKKRRTIDWSPATPAKKKGSNSWSSETRAEKRSESLSPAARQRPLRRAGRKVGRPRRLVRGHAEQWVTSRVTGLFWSYFRPIFHEEVSGDLSVRPLFCAGVEGPAACFSTSSAPATDCSISSAQAPAFRDMFGPANLCFGCLWATLQFSALRRYRLVGGVARQSKGFAVEGCVERQTFPVSIVVPPVVEHGRRLAQYGPSPVGYAPMSG